MAHFQTAKDRVLKLFRCPLAEVGRQLSSNRAIAAMRRGDSRLVWHVAMGKSGSTWLGQVIGQGLVQQGWRETQLAPAYGHREQEVDPRQLLLRRDLDRDVFAMHQHSPYSEYARDFIREFDVRVLLQIRSIPDCLMSLIDHFESESVIVPLVYLSPEQWKRLDRVERMRFVVDCIGPWYLKFWVGWSAALRAGEFPIHLVRYEELRADPVGQFSAAARFCDSTITNADVTQWIEAARKTRTRKNKGVVGRGRDLPVESREQLIRLAGYYPDVDFGPVGLDPDTLLGATRDVA